jgi:signal transduction histidine kinase
MYLYFSYAQSRDTRWEVAQYEDHLMDTEVSNLKEKVHNMAQYVRYYDSRSSHKIKEDVKKIVHIAAGVAEGILESNASSMNRHVRERLALDALARITFEGKLGYLFVVEMNGMTLLHRDPAMVGKNILNIQDSNGKFIIHDFVRVARQDGEGFVDYYWYIPGEKDRKMRYKISYIKKINGTNWMLGAGEYLIYMRRFVRKDMLSYIANNSQFDAGYFFVTDSKSKTIYHPKGDATADAQEYLIEGVYRDDEYIAYTEYIAQYDWYITAVKDLKQVNASIRQNKAYILNRRDSNIQASLWIMLAMLMLSLVLSLYLSGIINRRLKTYEEQLRESNEHLLFQSRQALIGELLPMIAHQWRQPINKIASVLALMRFDLSRDVCDAGKIDQECAGMEESVEFMSETIDDFRTFYRPKNESEIANLSTLITKAIEFVDGSIRQKDIHLTTHLENIEYRLYANELLQVLINVIKNAADASSQHGKIVIELFEKESAVSVVVTDDGDGIPEEQIGKIFEPYFSTKENSMGLGLYMSKMIIEKHMHGTLSVVNLPEGGTRFTITLYRH